ncbi:unnamed protein product [Allacma fusca]|uniref:Uncharacterized protein n=1 Tax=Allacma fusca TaxID=39272 RepID=A0A8J2KRJ5_9HEXA|nr:unnamed protein product [Allacma fusca]
MDVLRNIENEIVEQLDVTDENSIVRFVQRCRIVIEHDTLDLYSFVLNADVSVPGKNFWLTEEQASSQMNVNFRGAVNSAEAFHSKLLEHKRSFPLQSRLLFDLTNNKQFAGMKAKLEQKNLAEF